MSDPSESVTIDCKRCGQTAPAAQNVVYGGALGDAIRANTCDACWREWLTMEVMVINELRLNFMDPKSQDILAEQMRQFLGLAGGAAEDPNFPITPVGDAS